jgi:hypothetical protein
MIGSLNDRLEYFEKIGGVSGSQKLIEQSTLIQNSKLNI